MTRWVTSHRPELIRVGVGLVLIVVMTGAARSCYVSLTYGWPYAVGLCVAAAGAISGALLVISGVFLQPENLTNREVQRMRRAGQQPHAAALPDVMGPEDVPMTRLERMYPP